jgi:hypothetical protein
LEYVINKRKENDKKLDTMIANLKWFNYYI